MKNRLLLLTLSLFIFISSYAQDNLANFKTVQVGVNIGSSFILGDVVPEVGTDIGIHAIKSFNSFFSIRSTLSLHQSEGFHYYTNPTSELSNRTILELGYNSFVNNYSTRLYDFTIEPLLTAKHYKLNAYIGLGPSYHFYNVRYDALDYSGNLYNFSSLTESIDQRGDFDRSDIAIVRNVLDGNFETSQATDKFFNKNNSFGLSMRTGMSYLITPKFNIGVDGRLLFSFNDNLDGFRSIDDPFIQNDQIFSVTILGSYIIGR